MFLFYNAAYVSIEVFSKTSWRISHISGVLYNLSHTLWIKGGFYEVMLFPVYVSSVQGQPYITHHSITRKNMPAA